MVAKLDCTGPCGDVVEFGCGYGTFTIPAARLIEGRVLALDIEPDMVAATTRRAEAVGLSNVIAEVRDFVADGCGVPAGRAGYAMLFNILHIENPVGLLRDACRALAPGSKAGIIHWRTDVETPRGPSTPIRPTAEQCRTWGEVAGLEFVRYESLCCCSWHWGLVMQRPTNAPNRRYEGISVEE
ncbi:MAG TPA: class I SAM-dependent methyltransferase [Gemmataceae bacterium]|jgi:SAM-dependent methyltransferase|nr:class I SAM-dependent methyltransferase [Gemmataceae bacterium]